MRPLTQSGQVRTLLINLFVSLALFAANLLWVPQALAHASLVSADPAPGATVPSTLAGIRLTFDEPLVFGSTLTLFTNGFQNVGGITSQIEGKVLRTTLVGRLAPGTYTVQWKAATADGHSVEGSYQFGVSESPRGGGNGFLIIGGVVLLGALLLFAVYFVRRVKASA